MRGEDRTSGALFSYVDVEARIPAKHPLRAMRRVTNAALAELDAAFSALYEGCGRPSIRSERQLVERLELMVSMPPWTFSAWPWRPLRAAPAEPRFGTRDFSSPKSCCASSDEAREKIGAYGGGSRA